MTARMVPVTVHLPVDRWRKMQSAAERRRMEPEVFAGELLSSVLAPSLLSSRQKVRRAQVAELMDLNYSATEIAARIGCSPDTVRADMRFIGVRRDAKAGAL